jgi:hypothetical protein
MTRLIQFTTAIVLAATVAACGGSSNTTSVVAPTGTLVTDTFTGTVQLLGVDSHNFTVTTGGNSINATLVLAGPPATITMGLGIGTPSSTGACSLLTSVLTAPGSTAQLNPTGAPAGTYCVVVGDVGNAAVPIAYTVTVAHT